MKFFKLNLILLGVTSVFLLIYYLFCMLVSGGMFSGYCDILAMIFAIFFLGLVFMMILMDHFESQHSTSMSMFIGRFIVYFLTFIFYFGLAFLFVNKYVDALNNCDACLLLTFVLGTYLVVVSFFARYRPEAKVPVLFWVMIIILYALFMLYLSVGVEADDIDIITAFGLVSVNFLVIIMAANIFDKNSQ